MEITLILKGATPAEVREALRELYAQGTPGEPMEAKPVEVEESVVEEVLKKEKPVNIVRRKWENSKVKWTKEMEDFIMKRSYLTDAAITEALTSKFGIRCSTSAVNHRLQRIKANKAREIYIDGEFFKNWTD